jgi:hypothetical protein
MKTSTQCNADSPLSFSWPRRFAIAACPGLYWGNGEMCRRFIPSGDNCQMNTKTGWLPFFDGAHDRKWHFAMPV